MTPEQLRPHPPGPLKRRRLMVGYTLEQIAALTGINHSTLSRLEHGRQVPQFVTARKLAVVLGCEVEWLFPGCGRDRCLVVTDYERQTG